MKTHQLSQEQMTSQILKVLDNAHTGFFALDRKWRYVYLNPVAKKNAQISGGRNPLGKIIWEVFPTSPQNNLYRKYHEAMKTGKSMEFDEHVDGKWFDIHIVPVKTGIWVFYRDITEQKLADQRKDEFIRMTSHELKTPITSLKLYAELLRDPATTEEASEYINNINHQADQLNSIITDMLDLSQIEAGRLKFQKRRFDLVALLKELVSSLQKHIPQVLETDFQIDKATVYGDQARLRQALTNLINNASKYSPGRDRIIVSIRKSDKSVEVVVKDFGIGIDPHFQNKIFDRFFQPATSKGKSFPGLGIGLYLVKMIVTGHRGTISVKSAPNEGSTFTLSLPWINR